VVSLGGLNVAGTVTVANTGGSQPVSIMQPYLGMNFVICLEGIFPSRN
jgi:microcystin-dependent protein